MENENLAQESLNQEDSINLRHYWHVVLERRWLILTVFICVFILSLIYLFKATPIYRATVRLQIDQEADSILKIEGLAVGRQEQDYLQTQYKKLMSRTVIEHVIKDLKLDQDERYSKKKDIVKAVGDDFQVAPIRLSRLVDISAEHPDAEKAARMANVLVSNFIELNITNKIIAALQVADRLKTAAEEQRLKLEKAETNRQAYLEKHQDISLEENEDIISQALKQLQGDYAKAQSEAASAQTAARQVELLLKDGTSIYSIPQVASSPELQQLQSQLALAEADFAEIQQRYKSQMPDYKRAEQKVAALKNHLKSQADSIIDSIRIRAIVAVEAEQKQLALVRTNVQNVLNLKKLRIDYAGLKREAEENEKLYNLVLSKVQETELTGKNKVNNMEVVDKAFVPIKPVKPRKALTLFLGVVGGLGVALGLAFFVNYLDDSVKSQDDVETYLRLPFLGYVPNIKTNSVVERDLQAHLHPQSNAAEGFRTIRATISLTHKPEKFRILSITSTIPSEGKSLVASNLAVVTAQTGLKTLLVDADLRRPSVHKAYQLHSPVGLSAYLMDEVSTIDQIVHKTEVPNLDVICCGAVPTTPSELVGSKRMLEFLESVRNRYDRVILDCPPISAVSDPLIIAANSDGVVFVTKFNKIRREHARKSVQRIQNAGVYILGVVLNDIDFEGKDSYYYSYYYYQNRYYASHYKTTPDRASKEKSDELVKTRNGSNGNGLS